ncbi:MAG: Uma2 family endonuclease [Herpetosiphonaceae bacterium]|nr:Uma2 family endonuclease [Herpetosiphonaceae bacterium]
MATAVARRQFSVVDYHRMVKAGILGEDDRVELIAGEVLEMSPIGTRHAACVDRLNAFLTREAGANAIVRVQSPILLDDYSEPQPDLALLRVRDDYYMYAHPTPADVLLVVEVSDSSMTYDHEVKLPLYAEATIGEVWLVNIPTERIECYTQPVDGSYKVTDTLGRGQTLTSTVLPNLATAIDSIFG